MSIRLAVIHEFEFYVSMEPYSLIRTRRDKHEGCRWIQNPRGNTLEFHPQGTSLRMDSRQYHQGDLEETNVSLEPSR